MTIFRCRELQVKIMKNPFEKHPAYEEEEDLEIKTPEELGEAKRMAGVTTHEEAMERFNKSEQARAEKTKETYHNPEDFQHYLKEMDKAIAEKKIQLNARGYMELFAATDNATYFNDGAKRIEKLIGESNARYDDSGASARAEIISAAKILAENDKIDFIPTILNLGAKVKGEPLSGEGLVEILLRKGKKEEAERYLPQEKEGKIKSIDEVIKDNWSYAETYVKGLIETGKTEEAREFLTYTRKDVIGGVSEDLYLAGGKTSEDFNRLDIFTMLKFIKEGIAPKDIKTDEALDLVRQKIKAEIEKEKNWPAYYYLGGLVKSTSSAEDLKWATESFDKLLEELNKENKGKKIEVNDALLYSITPQLNLLRISEGLVTKKLDSASEEKVLDFLKQIDFEKKPERDSEEDKGKGILRKIAENINPENKRIVDFVTAQSTPKGSDFANEILFKVGNEQQKNRVIDQIKRDILGNLRRYKDLREKEKEMRGQNQYLSGGEEGKRDEAARAAVGQMDKLLGLVFSHYPFSGQTDRAVSEAVELEKIGKEYGLYLRHEAGQYLSGLVDKLARGREFDQSLKILGNPEFSKDRFHYGVFSFESRAAILQNLLDRNEIEKARELIDILEGNYLVLRLVVDVYKKGRKEEAEQILKEYAEKEEDYSHKAPLLFDTYLELLKLTK